MIFIEIDPVQGINLLVAVIFPVLVGLVTTRITNPGHKALLLAGLSVLTALGTELGAALADGVPYNLGAALLTGLGSFIIAVAMHYGLWKPTGVAERAQLALGGRNVEDDDYVAKHLREP